MPIRSNGYFNSPAFAQAASNLAGLFEPPSGAEAANWASANAKRDEASRLQQYFTQSQDPNVNLDALSRTGIGAGVLDFRNSKYGVDQGEATTRRGNDITAATSRANNADDNARALAAEKLSGLQKFYGNLGQGDIGPAVPAEIATQFGAPGALDQRTGAPKPLSETELKAKVLQGMPQNMQEAAAFGSTPIDPVVTPNGPRNALRPDAVGQVPYEAPKGNGLTVTTNPDGTTTVTQGGSGRPTEGQIRSGLAGDMMAAPAIDLLRAYDTGDMPTGMDYQMNQIKSSSLVPDALAPVLNANISDPGQVFYQNLKTVIPYELMVRSGLATTEGEYQRMLRSVVPVPGEAEGVKAGKRRDLETFIRAIARSAGPAAGDTLAKLDAYNASRAAPAAPGAVPAPVDAATGAPAAPTPAPVGPGPDPRAVEYLKANPDAAAQFDAKYGAGASASVLGGQ